MTHEILSRAQVARTYGVDAQKLSDWERMGLILPARGPSIRNRRVWYDSDDIDRVLVIKGLREKELTFDEIRYALTDPHWRITYDYLITQPSPEEPLDDI